MKVIESTDPQIEVSPISAAAYMYIVKFTRWRRVFCFSYLSVLFSFLNPLLPHIDTSLTRSIATMLHGIGTLDDCRLVSPSVSLCFRLQATFATVVWFWRCDDEDYERKIFRQNINNLRFYTCRAGHDNEDQSVTCRWWPNQTAPVDSWPTPTWICLIARQFGIKTR